MTSTPSSLNWFPIQLLWHISLVVYVRSTWNFVPIRWQRWQPPVVLDLTPYEPTGRFCFKIYLTCSFKARDVHQRFFVLIHRKIWLQDSHLENWRLSVALHCNNLIWTATASSVKFRGIRPRMYIEDLLWGYTALNIHGIWPRLLWGEIYFTLELRWRHSSIFVDWQVSWRVWLKDASHSPF